MLNEAMLPEDLSTVLVTENKDKQDGVPALNGGPQRQLMVCLGKKTYNYNTIRKYHCRGNLKCYIGQKRQHAAYIQPEGSVWTVQVDFTEKIQVNKTESPRDKEESQEVIWGWGRARALGYESAQLPGTTSSLIRLNLGVRVGTVWLEGKAGPSPWRALMYL